MSSSTQIAQQYQLMYVLLFILTSLIMAKRVYSLWINYANLASAGNRTFLWIRPDTTEPILVVLFYDVLLTFASEIENIWKSKLSSSKILFIVLRYSFALDLAIGLLLMKTDTSDKVSHK
jgi:hypothetical protein